MSSLRRYISDFLSDGEKRRGITTFRGYQHKIDVLLTDSFLPISNQNSTFKTKIDTLICGYRPAISRLTWENPHFLELPACYRSTFNFPATILTDVFHGKLFLTIKNEEDFQQLILSVQGALFDYLCRRIKDRYIGEQAEALFEAGKAGPEAIRATALYRKLFTWYVQSEKPPSFIKTEVLKETYRLLNIRAAEIVETNGGNLGIEIDFFKKIREATSYRTAAFITTGLEDGLTFLLSRFVAIGRWAGKTAVTISIASARFIARIITAFLRGVGRAPRLFLRMIERIWDLFSHSAVTAVLGLFSVFRKYSSRFLRLTSAFLRKNGSTIQTAFRHLSRQFKRKNRVFRSRGYAAEQPASPPRFQFPRFTFTWTTLIFLLPISLGAIMIIGETTAVQAKAEQVPEHNERGKLYTEYNFSKAMKTDRNVSAAEVVFPEIEPQGGTTFDLGERSSPEKRDTQQKPVDTSGPDAVGPIASTSEETGPKPISPISASAEQGLNSKTDGTSVKGLFYFEDNDTDFGNRLHFTFDDGPNMETIMVSGRYGAGLHRVSVTEYILDTLERYDCKATFFINGKQLLDKNGQPRRGVKQLINRMIDEGHVLANHSFHHDNLAAEPYDDGVRDIEEIKQEITTTQEALDTVLGYHYNMTYFRPPYAEPGRNAKVDRAVEELDLTMILFQIDSFDYRITDTTVNGEEYVLSHLKQSVEESSGGLILMHDIPFTAYLLPEIIETVTSVANENGNFQFTSIARLLLDKYHPSLAGLRERIKPTDPFN